MLTAEPAFSCLQGKCTQIPVTAELSWCCLLIYCLEFHFYFDFHLSADESSVTTTQVMLVPHRQQSDSLKMCYSRSSLNRLGLTTGEVGLYPAKLQPPLNSPWNVLLSYLRWASEHQTLSAPASGGSRVVDEKYLEGKGRTGNQIPQPGNIRGRLKVIEVPHRGSEEEYCHG